LVEKPHGPSGALASVRPLLFYLEKEHDGKEMLGAVKPMKLSVELFEVQARRAPLGS